mmetsp:Transcript_33736/g.41635  ORF Transcript_33736/g.41635 Transcript_33736/m.41635 type:complete len:213 (+) Transcript_33736:61-699(+)
MPFGSSGSAKRSRLKWLIRSTSSRSILSTRSTFTSTWEKMPSTRPQLTARRATGTHQRLARRSLPRRKAQGASLARADLRLQTTSPSKAKAHLCKARRTNSSMRSYLRRRGMRGMAMAPSRSLHAPPAVTKRQRRQLWPNTKNNLIMVAISLRLLSKATAAETATACRSLSLPVATRKNAAALKCARRRSSSRARTGARTFVPSLKLTGPPP